ncbi:HalOD1 output domain-containing protein [Natrinema sp. CGMCC1.2065]|uniref:HalOD1 output domain-containing protein n=1 Tax=Natrinema sp. CGMCC1.2065 TaxID=3445767 RepID=UPI003F4A3AC9
MTNSSTGTGGDAVHETVSSAVVNVIATHRNVDPVDLPPLYEWIDPDAIDALFEPTRTGGPRHGRLEFDYDGQRVAVDCTDDVEISIDGASAAPSISGRQSNA